MATDPAHDITAHPLYVIGISGGVGAGKSTLVEALKRHLANSTVLHFDLYERMTEASMDRLSEWMEAGSDPQSVSAPGLAEELGRLKMSGPPGSQARNEYLLFETPLGRRHTQSGQHIDLLVWLETPLDIALARKLRQLVTDRSLETTRAAGPAGWLVGYLDNYLSFVARLMRIQAASVAAQADLVLDGELPVGRLVQLVDQWLKARAATPGRT